MDDLHTDLSILQSHLDSLIDCVRQNEAKLHRFQSLETNLLSLNSLRELVEHTLNDTLVAFDLDLVSLVLMDEQQQLRQCLTEDGLRVEKVQELILQTDATPLERTFGKAMRPYLGACQREMHEIFFRQAIDSDFSIALLPLCRRGKLLGSLNLCSADSNRFGKRLATDFLDRLTNILGVCLENTLNFELLRRTSFIDTLTNVNNRRFFDQRIGEEIDRVMRSGECLSCLFLDIDHFKKINDSFGHQTGDLVLAEVAQTIRSLLRNNDVLARYGGEEFVALLAVASEVKAVEVAERIRLKVAQSQLYAKDGSPINVYLSIGVATLQPALLEDSAVDSEHLIELADLALYRAKDSGRNRVVSAGVIVPDKKKPPMAVNH